MTREEIYNKCLEVFNTFKLKRNTLLLELPTGFGKTALSIRLVNRLASIKTTKPTQPIKMLLLVAKIVHKQTWKDEFDKWGGIQADVTIECYESMHKHTSEHYDVIVADEVHHIGSEARLEMLKAMGFTYMIGLSATIPLKLKQYLKFAYHAQIVSCKLTEAIEHDILPEPQIILFPLQVENTRLCETIEVNPKAPGPIVDDEYKNIWKYKRNKNIHARLRCTQKQKLIEMNSLIDWSKRQYMTRRNKALENTWLFHCGKRLEFLANCKNPIIRLILHHLKDERTITFCKSIEQCETLGKNCIHSQNSRATEIYDNFNKKKINHITAVNILNENANLVDCKYAIFANMSSSDISVPQRIGRSLRHKSPVIIIPYYVNTREQELVEKMLEGFNKEYIKTIKNISEI